MTRHLADLREAYDRAHKRLCELLKEVDKQHRKELEEAEDKRHRELLKDAENRAERLCHQLLHERRRHRDSREACTEAWDSTSSGSVRMLHLDTSFSECIHHVSP